MAVSDSGLLLLFDIDGTLLTFNGKGKELLDETLEILFGPQVTCNGIRFSGRTDLAIVAEVLQNHGVPPQQLQNQVSRTVSHYVRRAQGRYLPSDVTVLPGVAKLIGDLEVHPHTQLGLVTGNARDAAYLKLDAAGLATSFPIGSFGDDHSDRNHLPQIAIERALGFWGVQYEGQQVVVVGDSEKDIHCGRHAGAYCIAVATGVTPKAVLASEKPDLLLDNLADTDAILGAIEELLSRNSSVLNPQDNS